MASASWPMGGRAQRQRLRCDGADEDREECHTRVTVVGAGIAGLTSDHSAQESERAFSLPACLTAFASLCSLALLVSARASRGTPSLTNMTHRPEQVRRRCRTSGAAMSRASRFQAWRTRSRPEGAARSMSPLSRHVPRSAVESIQSGGTRASRAKAMTSELCGSTTGINRTTR